MTKIISDRIAVYLLIGGLLFRTIIALGLYPGYDEAYYYVYSHNLDWSYFDHPPIVAISTGFGTWITGLVNQFTIRFGTLLLYTGSLCLLYLTALKLFSLPVARMTLAIAT
ncbi:MAG: 4-amino-4-deoxy-L-arabinose transferase, partial [Microcystis sp.]